MNENVYGGWLTGLSNELLKHEEIELGICFPHNTKVLVEGTTDGFAYYGFPRSIRNYYMYDQRVEMYFNEVLHKFKPDIIHIFGTEYPHTLAMTRVCGQMGLREKVIITIQGLMTACKDHYYCGLPRSVIHGFTMRDFLLQNNIRQTRNRFVRNGKYEAMALNQVNYVIGRTDFDRAVTRSLNPQLTYYSCNEAMRDCFYEKTWSLDSCKRHSIFISQGNYPIKGFHKVLEALPYIIKEYPDCHIYVAGNDITKWKSWRDKVGITNYGKYIRKLIHKKNLQQHITFLGRLKDEEMCNQYINSHVFVSPSSIENSPNSVSEALLLGVPTVSSFVGGVSNLLIHKVNGFLYQQDAPYMLAYYVMEIFSNDQLAESLSFEGIQHSRKLHDRKIILDTMVDIYKIIVKRESKSEEEENGKQKRKIGKKQEIKK